MPILFNEVPSLGLVHVAIEELQEIKMEDKLFGENEDMYEVIYLDKEKLLEDAHSCENQDLLLGGSSKLEDEVSLSCLT